MNNYKQPISYVDVTTTPKQMHGNKRKIDSFVMGQTHWDVYLVAPNDPKLVDRTGKLTVATTDPKDFSICLSSDLYGDFLMTVFIHELGHCALWSFGLLPRIHDWTYPKHWIDMEELICNILADYGLWIYKTAFQTLGYEAWKKIPSELEKFVGVA